LAPPFLVKYHPERRWYCCGASLSHLIGVSVLFDFDSGRYRWKSLGAEDDLERLEEY